MSRAHPANEMASSRAVFTPSIASEILNLHPRTLISTRARDSEEDIRRVQVIQFLTREKGVNLAVVK